jgi:two-component system, NarL family, sensor histidine kinase DevS
MVVLTREQIEERLVALHRASLELVSDLSLETLLERIVSLAREQVNARYAALAVLDYDGNFEQFIPVGMSQEEISRMAHPPTGEGLLSVSQRGARTVRIADITKDPRSAGFPRHHPPMKSFLGVPIMLGDFLLGQIYLTDKEDYPEFTEDDERVIETMAAYAAVAISNARLYRDLLEQDRALAQRNEDLALLNDVAAALASSLEVDEILDRTLGRVMSYMKVEAGEIFLTEEGGRNCSWPFTGGLCQSFLDPGALSVGGRGGGDGRSKRQAVHHQRAAQRSQFPTPGGGESRLHLPGQHPVDGARERDRRDECGHPQPTQSGQARDQPVDRHRHLGRHDHRERAPAPASPPPGCARRARPDWDGPARRDHPIDLRGRAGAGLRPHGDQGRPATGLRQDRPGIEGLNSTIGDIRSYISDLRPRQLGGRNLREGLQRLIEEYQINTCAEAHLLAPPDGLTALPTEHATALFHICQEALANVAKHAHAKRAEVQLWTTTERAILEVADNGKGFDVDKTAVSLGHGLANMRTRAHRVGGDVEISSEPGEGTTVLAWVPLHD